MKFWCVLSFILAIIALIYVTIWGFHIVPIQLDFSNGCEDICLKNGMDYETSFRSIPWDNLNGRCYCKAEIHTAVNLYKEDVISVNSKTKDGGKK